MPSRFKRETYNAPGAVLSGSNLPGKSRQILIIVLPVAVLFIGLALYIDLLPFIREFLKITAFFASVLTIQYVLQLIEVKLGFKMVGQVQVLAKFNLFFFKVIMLRRYLPLILEPQNREFDLLKKHDYITIEKTALNRMITWRKSE